MWEGVKSIVVYIIVGCGGVVGLFLCYVVLRVFFSAIFRSYFEEKKKTLKEGGSNDGKR